MLQELLDKYNLKYEDLNPVERETLRTWLESLSKNTLTIDDVRKHVTHLKETLELELAGFNEPKTIWEYLFRRKKDLYQRARLKNYMVILSFLTAPDKAKQMLESRLKGLK